MRVWRRIKAERSADKKLRTCIDLGIKIWRIKRTEYTYESVEKNKSREVGR
jgi:hypothetical protein